MDLAAYEPIGDYGIIGNLHTVALVSKTGSLDYLPFMRIDSPTVFARLLDAAKGGSFSVRPAMEFSTKQFYLPYTNMLVTRFQTSAGVAEVTDFMPVSENEYHCAVIRMVKAVVGETALQMECSPAFLYATSAHKVEREENGCLFVPDTKEQTPLRLTADVPVQIDENSTKAQVLLKAGQTCFFLLEAKHSTTERTDNTTGYIQQVFAATYRFWKEWSNKISYEGLWKEQVLRSALALKLLVSHRYGAPVAAATFGLPEAVGGERNWDYRYTWVRDAAFTMYVFMQLKMYDEADKFIEWIKRQCSNDGLQLLYAVDGTKKLEEARLPHLEGYKKSKPVRVGNDAYRQRQIDIYGELLDTVYIFVTCARSITIEFWQSITEQVQFVVDNWQKPDHSIWEFRKEKKEFLYSRFMCWVALDRAIKIAEHCSFPYPADAWRKARDTIYQDVFEHFWNKKLNRFVQHKGSAHVDASLLLMPVFHFISPYSEYWQGTLKAIESELVSDCFVYRYKVNDKLSGEEGAFTICSFWYVLCLAKGGERHKAVGLFERLIAYANHLGLFSEQIGMDGHLLGNFPQAFTHLSLINAAIELSQKQNVQK